MSDMKFRTKEVTRGIVKRLEKIISNEGYLPDRDDFVPSSDPQNKIAYQAAKDAIVNSGKKIIEVYSNGTPNDRMDVNEPCFWVDHRYVEGGDVGFGHTICIVPDVVDENNPENNTFKKVREPDHLQDIEYEIRFVADDVSYYRECTEILVRAFGERAFVYGANDDRTLMDKGFWFFKDGVPLEVANKNGMERVYRFQAKDIILGVSEEIEQNIPSINTISIQSDPSDESAPIDKDGFTPFGFYIED